MSDMNRVAEIIRHEKEADKIQLKADDHRWEAARLISEELESGKTQKALAKEISKTQGHVSKCAALWKKFSDENDRPTWAKAYNSVSSRPSKTSSEPKAESESNTENLPESQPVSVPEPTPVFRTYDGRIETLLNQAMSADSWDEAVASFEAAWNLHHRVKLAA
jgi:hypothetical protein